MKRVTGHISQPTNHPAKTGLPKKSTRSRFLVFAAIVWISLGTFAWVKPSVTYDTIVRYSGIVLLMDGILLVVLSYGAVSSKKEKNWRFFESVVDFGFAIILLLDPLFSLFAFPFVIGPWMAAKGLLKMISSVALAKKIRGWNGDFIAGAVLFMFSILIPNDPIENPYGTTFLIGIIGLTLGAVYLYDYYRPAGRRHIPSV